MQTRCGRCPEDDGCQGEREQRVTHTGTAPPQLASDHAMTLRQAARFWRPPAGGIGVTPFDVLARVQCGPCRDVLGCTTRELRWTEE